MNMESGRQSSFKAATSSAMDSAFASLSEFKKRSLSILPGDEANAETLDSVKTLPNESVFHICVNEIACNFNEEKFFWHNICKFCKFFFKE